jgi:hypothetical protein
MHHLRNVLRQVVVWFLNLLEVPIHSGNHNS